MDERMCEIQPCAVAYLGVGGLFFTQGLLLLFHSPWRKKTSAE